MSTLRSSLAEEQLQPCSFAATISLSGPFDQRKTPMHAIFLFHQFSDEQVFCAVVRR